MQLERLRFKTQRLDLSSVFVMGGLWLLHDSFHTPTSQRLFLLARCQVKGRHLQGSNLTNLKKKRTQKTVLILFDHRPSVVNLPTTRTCPTLTKLRQLSGSRYGASLRNVLVTK